MSLVKEGPVRRTRLLNVLVAIQKVIEAKVDGN